MTYSFLNNLLALSIFVKNSIKGLRFIFSRNNLEWFPSYPSFFLPTLVSIKLDEVDGYISIANKPGRGLNCVADIVKSEVVNLEDLFNKNPKYVTAKQVLVQKETEIENLSEYSFYKEMLKKNGVTRGFTSEVEIFEDMRKRVTWYHNLKSVGYVQQAKGQLDYNSEIQIAMIGQKKFLKVNGGNHRYAAFSLLGFEDILAHPIAYDREYLKSFGKILGYKVIWQLRKDLKS